MGLKEFCFLETFSDEEDTVETPQTCQEEKIDIKRQEASTSSSVALSPSTSRPDDVSSLAPWSRRSIRVERTTTYLGQTFVLPSRDKSPPAEETPGKRPRLSLSSPPYKYISSLSHSPKKPLGCVAPPVIKRQFSRSSESGAVDSKDRLTWLLQILSRLSHADRPHSDLTSVTTVDVLFLFVSRLPTSEVAASKAAKILTRKV